MSFHQKRVLLLGGTGFIGNELGRELAANGWAITVLTQHPDQVRGQLAYPADVIAWDGGKARLPPDALTGCHAVVNLAGAGIADERWTKKRKQQILQSRVDSTTSLAEAIAAASTKPAVVVQASAVGYYGDARDKPLTETSPPGDGFLADVCVAWEKAAAAIADQGVRLVKTRFGSVLGLTGGALPELINVYAKGIGSVLGPGTQWFSWVHVDDLVRLIHTAIQETSWRGPINAVAPVPCTNADFHAALTRLGKYPSIPVAVPSPALKVVLGERAELFLASAKVRPAAAVAHGFKFKFATIEDALTDLVHDDVGKGLQHFCRRQWLPVAPDKLWPFFTDPKNLERITPPWLSFHIDKTSSPVVGEGTTIDYKLKLRGIPMTWRSRIAHWDDGKSFVDVQERGPYSLWHHTHAFEPLAGGTLMTDHVRYKVPLAAVGDLVAGTYVRRDVDKIFAFRSRVMTDAGVHFGT